MTQLTPHSFAAKFSHWGFIVIYVYALAKQFDEVEELEDPRLLQAEMIFAGIFLVLLIARFIFMQSTRPSALPKTPKRDRLLARIVHLAMYFGLAVVALTRLIIGGLYESGTKDGRIMELALLVHEIAVNTSYLLIIVHVMAALYHRSKRDGIWGTMVPFWKESRFQ